MITERRPAIWLIGANNSNLPSLTMVSPPIAVTPAFIIASTVGLEDARCWNPQIILPLSKYWYSSASGSLTLMHNSAFHASS